MNQIIEGIYLETKQSKLGTGHTSSNVVFRTFWAARPAGELVEVYLLDNQLAPTGLAELMSPAEFLGKGWMLVAQLAARYEGLKAMLKPIPHPAPPVKAAPAAPQAQVAPAAQAAPAPAQPAAKPAPSPASAKPVAKTAAKPAPKEQAGGWWEMTSRGSDLLTKK